jgi:hypothetical protein
MSETLNNKELIAVGHEFAKAMTSDTPIIEIAKMMSRLAERLDCTTAVLREMTKQRDALGAESTMLKELIEQHAGSIAVCPNCSHEEPSETDDIVALYRSMKAMATDALQAEMRHKTVTLPTGYSVRPGHPINEVERGIMIPKDNGPWLSRHDVEHVLRVAGISIMGE